MSTQAAAAADRRIRNRSLQELARYLGTHDPSLWNDPHGLSVVVNGSTARLSGQARSWEERTSLEQAVRQRAGITCVENLITVMPEDAAIRR